MWVGGDGVAAGQLQRLTIGPWSDKDIKGNVLRVPDLSTRITKVASFQQTICNVAEAQHLLRRLNCEEDPAIGEVRQVKSMLVDVIQKLIASLHQSNFELMTDLIFSRSGWRRISDLGRTQADIDLALEHPATGERAFVQVKSAASQSVLNNYLKRCLDNGTYDHFFFVCHSPKGTLSIDEQIEIDEGIKTHVWSGADLATMAIDAGLIDWLMQKSQ